MADAVMKQMKSAQISQSFCAWLGSSRLSWQGMAMMTAAIAGLGNVSVLPEHDSAWVQIGQEAVIARSSGGVSGGGSFQQRSAPEPYNPPAQSQPRYNQPYNPPQYNQPNYQQPYYPPPVYIPRSNYNNQYNNQYNNNPYQDRSYNSNPGAVGQSSFGNMLPGLLMLLILGGGGIATILWLLPKLTSRRGAVTPAQEVANNTFAVTKVQVALVAQAHEIQERLSTLTTEVDTSTPEGLMRLLQESALALLRHTESWTHFAAQSQVARDALSAEQIFNHYTINAKSVLSAETLVNENGRVQKRDLLPARVEEDPAAYIVVTLLVGTAHDQPLFENIQAIAELQALLEQLAALPPQYLMTFKLIWSPQDASDSLSADELLTEYSDLVLL